MKIYKLIQETFNNHDRNGTTKSSLCSTFTSLNAVTALLSISEIYVFDAHIIFIIIKLSTIVKINAIDEVAL